MYIVNLSTTHDYSINETLQAFIQICNEHSNGCLRSMPVFFQNWTNSAWVMAKYKTSYASLIEPYKLGKISTEQFLDNLAEIFDFLKDMDRAQRNDLLVNAWNASIRISSNTQNRLVQLADMATIEPVYLISNTNELNIHAIFDLFQREYPDLRFNSQMDLSIQDSKEPIEILPNVFLCLSYRYGAFKANSGTTVGLIQHLANDTLYNRNDITVASQYSGDINKAKELGLNVQNVNELYANMMHCDSGITI